MKAEPIDPREPLHHTWYAREDDVIGGWCVMPVDQPPSMGHWVVASFISKDAAEHIANLHNLWLIQETARKGVGRA